MVVAMGGSTLAYVLLGHTRVRVCSNLLLHSHENRAWWWQCCLFFALVLTRGWGASADSVCVRVCLSLCCTHVQA